MSVNKYDSSTGTLIPIAGSGGGGQTIQVEELPTAAAALVGKLYQYIGETNSEYTHGYFYECVNNNGIYSWENIPVQVDDAQVTSTDPYTFRQGKGNLADMEIVGASVGWNQLVQSTDTSVTVQSGHKYYANINGVKTIGLSNGTAITINDGTKDNVIDLTLLFGSTVADAIYAMEQATAGAGVAFFRKYFPKDYYAYDAGSIQSVSVGSRKVTGKNLFDENGNGAVFNGYISDSGVVKTSSSGEKSYICKIHAGTYTIQKPKLTTRYRIGVTTDYPTNNETVIGFVSEQVNNRIATYTSDVDGYLIIFGLNNSGETTTNSDMLEGLQVEIGTTATSYEPYTSTAYPFDSTKELRGMFSLESGELKANGDVYAADGNIQRKYGIVDLGTLSWTYSSNYGFYAEFTLAKIPAQNTIIANIITSCYVTEPYLTVAAHTGDKRIGLGANTNRTQFYLIVNDDAYTTSASFKTAMSGVYLVYELATPTTETAQPYQNPQRAYIDGTEEFTDGLTRDVMIPIGNETTYNLNAVLPDVEDYADGVEKVLQSQIDGKAEITAIGTDESGRTTSSKAYAIGDNFYKNGKFCTAIAAIASGATFTLNTNYVEVTIADALAASARIDIDPSAATISAYPDGTMWLVTS